ncbi:hypothetical protein [Streptomyces sp. NPDC020983]|uniref:hypothetical protein n=1 Tax=Streptomyces sp. NPDC020983 TaxID=3365106 RepID=UPI00379D315A
MASANSTGVRSRADRPGRIGPSYPLSSADEAAQVAARGGVRRLTARTGGWFPAASNPGDSDPDMDEAYRRALRRSTSAVAAVEYDKRRAIEDQVELAYIERADEYRTEVRDYLGSAA